MKYLIVEDFSGQPVCFLFPRRVDHGDMRDQLPYGRVISAASPSWTTAAFCAPAVRRN